MSGKKFNATKEELMSAYYSDPCIDRVADKFGVKKSCLGYWLQKYDISAFPNGGRNFKDLTGQVFGSLTVIKRVKNIRTAARWLCRCNCGNVKEIVGSTLRSGMSTSCGCKCGGHNKIDLIGKRFGRLVVIEEVHEHDLRWRCLCDCGKTCVIPAGHLNNKRRKSCGSCGYSKRGSSSYNGGVKPHHLLMFAL